MMPGIDGFDLCRRIREKVDCPILFLTAKTEEKDVMTGLGAGGDDYITKPFGIGELRARVAAHIRRENREKTHTICIGEVRFSMQENSAVRPRSPSIVPSAVDLKSDGFMSLLLMRLRATESAMSGLNTSMMSHASAGRPGLYSWRAPRPGSRCAAVSAVVHSFARRA